MPQYMLLMYHPVEGPPKEDWAGQREQWSAYHQRLVDDGVLVSNAGLAGVESATTVRVRDGETQVTDGPFAETKEILAGAILLDVKDLDAALGYAAQNPASAYGSIEVRPLWGG
jgi:hypothetical protein